VGCYGAQGKHLEQFYKLRTYVNVLVHSNKVFWHKMRESLW